MLMTLTALAIGRLAYGLLLPFMRADLGLTVQQAGYLGTATSLGYLAMVVPAGLVAARVGPRQSMLAGLVCLAGGCAGLGLAQGYASLLLLMVLLGVGTAFLYTPLIALLVGWFPSRRGAVIGIANSGIGIGMLAIGVFVPQVIEQQGNDGWRAIWMGFAVVTTLVLVSGWALVRNPPGWGAAPATGGEKKGLLSGFFVSGVYRNPGVRKLAMIYGVLGFTYIVQGLFMYSYALEVGISPVTAGQLAGMNGFLSIFAGALWGALSDKIGRARALMLSFALTLSATFLPVVLPVFAGFAIHYAITGLVVGGLFTIILAATSERTEPRLIPVAISFVTVVFALGQLLGPAVAAMLIHVTGRYEVAFTTSSILMILGVYWSWRISLTEG